MKYLILTVAVLISVSAQAQGTEHQQMHSFCLKMYNTLAVSEETETDLYEASVEAFEEAQCDEYLSIREIIKSGVHRVRK